jgi:hypothetical protein
LTKNRIVEILFEWAMVAIAVGFFVWYLWVKLTSLVSATLPRH